MTGSIYEKTQPFRRANALFLLLATAMSLCVSGCAIGFNKNGFYCTEGPVTDETPSCFGTHAPQRPVQTGTANEPGKGG